MKNNQENVYVISVVRNHALYYKCVSGNPCCARAKLVQYDNKTDNRSIAVRYNQFLDSYDYACSGWFVFCHEDFQFEEDIVDKLSNAEKDSIYGPIGGFLSPRYRWLLGGIWSGEFRGLIAQGSKLGSGVSRFGCKAEFGTVVDTVDCQCLIVHSSLVEKFDLRFDEQLSFDLYAEDYCINANLRYNVKTKIIPINCSHYSEGMILPRFFEQKRYLDIKYPKTEFFCTVGYTIGGGRTFLRRIQKRIRYVMDRRCPWLVNLIFRMLP